MSKIKFRAWDSHLKTMTYNIQILDSFNEYLSRDRYIIMQYIGLEDSKGIEIYEGDIIQMWDKEPYEITDLQQAYYEMTECVLDNTCKVVGNKYEGLKINI